MSKKCEPCPEVCGTDKPAECPIIVSNCFWSKADEDDDMYETSCGKAFTINEGTPTENDMKFCPFCGKRINDDEDYH